MVASPVGTTSDFVLEALTSPELHRRRAEEDRLVGKACRGAAGAGCRLTRPACKTNALLIPAAYQFTA